jgi:hypothetical protein
MQTAGGIGVWAIVNGGKGSVSAKFSSFLQKVCSCRAVKSAVSGCNTSGCSAILAELMVQLAATINGALLHRQWQYHARRQGWVRKAQWCWPEGVSRVLARGSPRTRFGEQSEVRSCLY